MRAFEHALAVEVATDRQRYEPTAEELAQAATLGLTVEQVDAAKRLGMGLLDYASFQKIANLDEFRAYKAGVTNAKP